MYQTVMNFHCQKQVVDSKNSVCKVMLHCILYPFADFCMSQDLSSALPAFSVHLPRFIQTITSLKTTGIPESIPVSIKQMCLTISHFFFE